MGKANDKLRDNKPSPKHYILVLRILFGLLFIFSGVTKVINVSEFQDAIMKFAIIPDYYVEVLSYSICILEIIVGFCITFNLLTTLMLQVIIYTLAFFTSVIVVQLVQGGDISCGCFGALSSDKIDLFTVIRNIILLLWSFILLYYYLKNKVASISKERFKEKIRTLLVTSCLLFFLVSNSALAIRNIELKNRIYTLLEKDILTIDELVVPFTAFKLDGSTEEIKYKQFDKTVLFIMQYGCGVCVKNIPYWNEINRMLISNDSIRVIGVSLDSLEITKKLISNYKADFELLFNPKEEFIVDYKLLRTPVTIIVNKNQQVKGIWKGPLTKKLMLRIKETLLI